MLEALCNFSAYLFHDFHIRSLGDLSRNFDLISMGWNLFHFMLCDFLIKDLIIELFWRFVNKSVIKLSSMWLNHIHLAR